jgi:hypothetical protein
MYTILLLLILRSYVSIYHNNSYFSFLININCIFYYIESKNINFLYFKSKSVEKDVAN